MIGFVTWPLFVPSLYIKWQSNKANLIVVKMFCELLYIIQVKGFLIKSFALRDIKVSGCLSLVSYNAGLVLFYSQDVFVWDLFIATYTS